MHKTIEATTSAGQLLNRTISILEDLVGYSVLGGESNLSIANYIENILSENDIQYHKVFDASRNKMSIHCRIGPEIDGGIILSGHMDVVSTKGQPWTKPDFKLTRKGDTLYGRGTADMKGFLACCLALLPSFKEITCSKPIYLAFSYDEEIGCRATAELLQSMQETYTEKPAIACIGEPTLMQIANAEKGAAFFKTEIFSAAAHSAEVRERVSAIEEAVDLVQWLMAKMDGFIGSGHIDHRFTPPYTTIHVGTIKGGEAVNIVADRCVFEWDVRNIPCQSIAKILEEFKAYCEERMAEKIKITPEFAIRTDAQFPIVPGFETSPTMEIVQLAKDLTDTKETRTLAFASEAGYFDGAGYQTIVCGPGSMEQGHRADEFVTIDQLEKCLKFLERLIRNNEKI